MTYFSFRFIRFIPYFVEMQRRSFLYLLEKGLIDELSRIGNISSQNYLHNYKVIFYPKLYKLRKPHYSPKQAILLGKSYSSTLYVPVKLINFNTEKIEFQWVNLGNFPLMTKRGHFIINGSPRVIIHQMVRSPGIYFQESFNDKFERTVYLDIIAYRGSWVRIEIDPKQRIWVKLKRMPKMSIWVFLYSIGLTHEQIDTLLKKPDFLQHSIIEWKKSYPYPHPISREQGLKIFYEMAYPRKPSSVEQTKKFISQKFFRKKTYDLSDIGRVQLNKKLKFTKQLKTPVLTILDITFALNQLIDLYHGQGLLDDIDNLKNRRVRASGELIQNQFRTGLIRLQKLVKKQKDKNFSISTLITPKSINGALKEFFNSSPLSQFMDQTNPLAELTHKRRITSLGPGGINRQTAGMAIRGIHSSHYGRICPIETPEGRNAGLVNSITVLTRKNPEGFLETPFYPVYQGQVQKLNGFHYVSAEQEEYIHVASGDVNTDSFDFLPKTSIPVRANNEFKKHLKNQVEYIGVSPVQMISIATSLIPFLEHDDGNRALMGSNMQRQAVPLLIPEKPVVGTGLESRIISDSGHGIQAKQTGFVSYVSNENIVIEKFIRKKIKNVVFHATNAPVLGITNLLDYWESVRKNLTYIISIASVPSAFIDTLAEHSVVSVALQHKKQHQLGHEKSYVTNSVFLPFKENVKSNLSTSTEKNKQISFVIKNQQKADIKKKILIPNLSSNWLKKKLETILLKNTFRNTNFSYAFNFKINLLNKKIHKKSFHFISNQKFLQTWEKYLFKLTTNRKATLRELFFCDYFLFTIIKKNNPYSLNMILNFTSFNENFFYKSATNINLFQSKKKLKNQFLGFSLEKQGKSNNMISRKLTISNLVRSSNLTSHLTFYPFHFKFTRKNVNHKLETYKPSNQYTCLYQRPVVKEGDWVQKGEFLADGTASVGGELALGKTILVAYMPWEGYNFEDAIVINERLVYGDIYTSLHIEKYSIEITDTKFGMEKITKNIPNIQEQENKFLDDNGIIKIGSWVRERDILVGKITPLEKKKVTGRQEAYNKFLAAVLNQPGLVKQRDTSLRVPKYVSGRVIHVEILEPQAIPAGIPFMGPGRVHVYIAEKRKIQIGDKMSGRHGNKGIVSKILPRQDMPYLPDGTPVDIILNPLGVPSRMNVGQILECLLGLSANQLNEQFKVICFDEMYGAEASRSLAYSKLFQASIKRNKPWLFNPAHPGKMKIFDGRTGECFDQSITVGQAYMLKLIHQVDEKIHARSTGPYSLVTQQPLKGRSKQGGQRLGEMEVWALESFGAAFILQELLTSKSDDIKGRTQIMQGILQRKSISYGTPESFKVVIRELQALCLDIGVYSTFDTGIREKIDIMQLS